MLKILLYPNRRLDIIQGDIKPENVLIFETSSGGYLAKVADFGYSTQYTEMNNLVNMPRSELWHAPEWHHRGFIPAQAMKMDAYSFGTLVPWVLHYTTKENSYLRLKSDLSQVSDDSHCISFKNKS